MGEEIGIELLQFKLNEDKIVQAQIPQNTQQKIVEYEVDNYMKFIIEK